MSVKKRKNVQIKAISKNAVKKNKKDAVKSKSSKKPKQIKQYEFLEHTADAEFIAHGKSFSGALANAVKATISVMTDISKIKKKQKRKVEIQSKSRESLTYDFLEEVIFLIDTEGFLTREIKGIKIVEKQNKYFLKAELVGDNARAYDVHTCIKAVTYNHMEINQVKNKCTIQVVLDI